MKRMPRRNRVRARSLRFESLEFRALLAADIGNLGPPDLRGLDSIKEQRAHSMKAALNEHAVAGLERQVVGDLLDVYRQYAAAYKKVTPDQRPQAEKIAAKAAFRDDSAVWTDSSESRVGVRVIISEGGAFASSLQQLTLLGYDEFASDFGYLLSEGSLPVWAIPEASKIEGVAALDVMHKPQRSSGIVTSQADGVLNADDVRGPPGAYTGAGVKVGVLSDSANVFSGGLWSSQMTGDLPMSVEILRDGPFNSSDEGRAMMELIHDIAPAASLSFRSAFWGELDFARGIHELAAAGADIIVDDIFYYAEPAFADGPIAQAVNHVVDTHGVAYFSSAGNHADDSYESLFRDSNPNTWDTSWSYNSGENLHDFDPGSGTDSTLRITVSGSGFIPITLQWDQAWYSAEENYSDFDVHVFNSNGGFYTSATRSNSVFRQPFEYLELTSGTYDIQINHVSGPEAVRLKLMAFTNGRTFTINEYPADSSKGTIVGHPAAVGAAAVAAAPYWDYDGSGIIEPFSSWGQPTFYFDSEYRRLTTPETRNKPDFTAPDGGNTTFFGSDDNDGDWQFPNFYGTSAAAPNAAAVAALLLQQRPSLSPTQLYDVLADKAIDRGTLGWDKVYGAGNIDALASSTALNIPENYEDVTGPLATEFSVQSHGAYPIDKFTVWFNDELEATAAATGSNYEIRNAGPDSIFGNGDDTTYSVTATYTDATRSVLVDPSGILTEGRYRLTLKSGTSLLRDISGNAVNAGTDQTYDFTIANNDVERVVDERELSMSWPDVAINSANQGVVVWADTTGFTHSVFVQRFDENGEPLSQSPFAIGGYAFFFSQEPNKPEIQPSVAMAEDGRFAVAYIGYSLGTSAGYRAVYVQRFNADGTLLGTPIRVDTGWTSNNSHQSSPDISIMPDGSKFSVVWEDGGYSDSNHLIQGIVYNWDGTTVSNVVDINTTSVGGASNSPWLIEPAVAMNSSGNWAVAWARKDGSISHTYSALYDVAGAALTPEVFVSSGANEYFDPDVAIDSSSNYNVAYGDGVLRVARYDSFGNLRELPFLVETTGQAYQDSPAISMEQDTGDFVVTWRSYDQDAAKSAVVARQYNGSGTPTTPEFVLNQTTPHFEAYPAVSMDSDGDIWTAWIGFKTYFNVGHAIYSRWIPNWANTSATDVKLTSWDVPSVASPGEKIDAEVTLYNPSFASTGSFGVSFYLSTDANVTTDDQLLGSSFVNSLSPGETRTSNLTVQLPAGLTLPSGYLGVIVDSFNLLPELDELNNSAAQPLELRLLSHSTGSDIKVNSTTSGTQELPAVAMDDQGRSVVVWSGNGSDDSAGIHFQRYNSAGQAQWVEARVNSTIANTQTDPAVGMNKTNGDFIVAWTSDHTGNNDIYFQKLDINGFFFGSEARVNTTTAGSQTDATVAVDDLGNFVIAWTSGSPSHIFARRYNSSGVALGSEFQVDTGSYLGGSFAQSSPSVSMDSAGNFVIAWASTSEENLGNSGIYYQRFDASGNRIGSQTHANTYTDYGQSRPTVALANDGKVIVAWVSSGQEAYLTSDSFSDGIYFQRFDTNNMPLSADVSTTYDIKEMRVNSYVGGNQLLPSISIADDGRFAIAWDSTGQDGSGRGIYLQKYLADGSTDGGMRRVNSATASDQSTPVITLGSSDEVMVAWQSSGQDGSGEGIYLQRFGMEGSPAAISEGFETASLSSGFWETYSSNEGRIQLTSLHSPHATIDVGEWNILKSLTIQNGYGSGYHLTLDDTNDNETSSLNEALLHVNLAGIQKPLLTFWEKTVAVGEGNGDEHHPMSASFTGHENSDGVAISSDGVTWYRIWSEASTATYTRHSFRLDTVVQQIQLLNPSFALTSDTVIKFQQYDNSPAFTDGLMFDDIQVVAPKIWDGGGGANTNWSNAANWSGNTIPQPTDYVLFDETYSGSVNLDGAANAVVAGVIINPGFAGSILQSKGLTVGSGGFTLADGSYNAGGQALTVYGNFSLPGGFFSSHQAQLTLTGGPTGNPISMETGDALFVTQDVTFADGSIDGGTIETRGNVTANSAFDSGSTTTLVLAGTATQTLNLANPDRYNGDIVINKSAGQVNLTSGLIMDSAGQDLTILGSTSILNLGANNLTVAGSFSNTGTLKLQGVSSQAINLAQDINSGTWEYVGDGDGLADTFTLRDFGATDYFNLKINATDANDTFQAGAGSPKVFAGAFSLLNGMYDANSNNTTMGSLSGATPTNLGSGTLSTGTDNTHTIYSGAISGSGGLTKVGLGSFYLRGANTYDGVTTVGNGYLLVSTNNALGTTTGGTVVQSGAALFFEKSVNYTTPEPVTINGSGYLSNGSLIGVGNSTFAGPITLGSASTLTAVPANYTFTLNGPINNAGHAVTVKGTANTNINGVVSGSGALVKEGTGVVALSNTNTYGGTTTISEGTLLVNGSTSSATTVAMNAILGGAGTVGAITANSGTVSPGGVSGIGILSGSSANFSNGGILRIQLQGYGAAGTSFDRLNLSGGLTAGGTSKLILDMAGLPSATGTATGVIQYSASPTPFTTVDVLSPPAGHFVCLAYTPTSLNVTIQTGACGQWFASSNEAGASGVLDTELLQLQKLASRAGAVTVASLDSGVDYTHPALYQSIWLNEKEIPATIKSKLKDFDGDGRISLRDLNRSGNQGQGRITDLNKNGLIDGGDVLAAWTDGKDTDGNGYVDDLFGWDFVNNDNNPLDDSGHGTHGAGIMAQIAPKVEILPLKFLDENAVGSLPNAQLALRYALQQKVPISSNGWAASVYSTEWHVELRKAEAAGHVFVTAAGNGDPALLNILRQMNLNNIWVVTSVDTNGYLPSFSNWDPNVVDLAAPGVGIVSTMPGGGYAARSGTSASTAYAAGVAALLRGVSPSLATPDLVDAVLGGAAADLTAKANDQKRFLEQLAAAADAYYASLTRETYELDDDERSLTWRQLRAKYYRR